MEKWKKIPSFAGYEVSNLGQIRSYHCNSGGYRKEPKILKLSVKRCGYIYVCLYQFRKRKYKRVHRLVMLAFRGPSNLQVNHINCTKDDNQLENLEYCTNSENQRHAHKNGLINQRGVNNNASKLTDNQVKEIKKLLKNKIVQSVIAKKFKVNQATIGYINTGKTWGHI